MISSLKTKPFKNQTQLRDVLFESNQIKSYALTKERNLSKRYPSYVVKVKV